jgi:hypothetical protein
MRNIVRVIGIMLEDIPVEAVALRAALDKVRSSAKYAPPELQQLNWQQLAEVVNSYIPQPPTPLKHWQQWVVDAFMGTKG